MFEAYKLSQDFMVMTDILNALISTYIYNGLQSEWETNSQSPVISMMIHQTIQTILQRLI